MKSLYGLAMEYLDRKCRRAHPDGHSDGKRWYPSATEMKACCASIRRPSAAYPWSYMTHCRTADHIAEGTPFTAADIRREARRIESKKQVLRYSMSSKKVSKKVAAIINKPTLTGKKPGMVTKVAAKRKAAPVKTEPKAKIEKTATMAGTLAAMIIAQKYTKQEMHDALVAQGFSFKPTFISFLICDINLGRSYKKALKVAGMKPGDIKRFIRDESGKLIEAAPHQRSASPARQKKLVEKKKLVLTKVKDALPE